MEFYKLKNLRKIHKFFKFSNDINKYKLCIFFQINPLNASALNDIKKLLKKKSIELKLIEKNTFSLKKLRHFSFNYDLHNNTYAILFNYDDINVNITEIKKIIEEITLNNFIPAFVLYDSNILSWNTFNEVLTHNKLSIIPLLEISHMDIFNWIENKKCLP